jgi:hypothetical protein
MGTGSGSCAESDFGINGVKPLCSAAPIFDGWLISTW